MIKEIEVGGVKHSITLADDMVGQGLMKDENGVVSVDVENLEINEEKLVKTTWAELKALRDEAKLNAGTFYRITDYVTTTTQSQTKSANHPFDVIVLALSENTLCEDAKAALHEGDTYFADSDLSAWELKYCLDNDKTRFAWADETNGKGVIYRMVDENHNDCPYDFKNILHSGYYTFYFYSDDASIAKFAKVAYNTIHWRGGSIEKVTFDIPAFGVCRYNSVGAKSSGQFFGSLENNIIGDSCSFIIEDSSNNNIIGNGCRNIRIKGSSNIVKSYNRNLSVRSSNTVVEEHFNDDGYKYPEISKSATTYTSSVQRGENFYDDGSGQVVPIKHPDLSTQPSILPYKFMGQYVYEQLIPKSLLERGFYITSDVLGIPMENVIFLEAYAIYQISRDAAGEYEGFFHNLKCCKPAVFVPDSGGLGLSDMDGDEDVIYYRIVYTSMPEEDSSYYGYNNYGGGG